MCDIAMGIDGGCTNSSGGVEEFYPFNFVKDAFTVVNGVATAMSINLTVAYKYVITGDGNTLTQSQVSDHKIGSSFVTQTLVNQIKQIDGAKNFELGNASKGKISGVLKDNNGVYHYVAKDRGFDVTSTIESVTGGAMGDMNGYNVTLIAETKELAPVLDSATVDAFLLIVQ